MPLTFAPPKLVLLKPALTDACFPPVPMVQAEQEDRKRKLEQEANAASQNLAGGSVPGAEGVVEIGKDGAFDVDQTPMVCMKNASTFLATVGMQSRLRGKPHKF